MVYKVGVPRKILEEIAKEGEKESRKDREAVGLLLGKLMDEEIKIFKKFSFHSKKSDGNYNFHQRLFNRLKTLYLLFYMGLNLATKPQKFSLVLYHTHPKGSWSIDDLFASNYMKLRGLTEEDFAMLLYIANVKEFKAIDIDGFPLEIERI